MGSALVSGLVRAGRAPSQIAVVDLDDRRLSDLAERHPGLVLSARVEDLPEVTGGGAVLAVKPAEARAACSSLRGAGVCRVLSVAAGVTIASIEEWTGRHAAVMRAMPNTPALVGAGVAALAAGAGAGPDDRAWAREVLEGVGIVVELAETQLDAVTGLSGSGPAYVFLFAEALVDAGVLVGLARPVARELALHTLLGSSRLLLETGEEASALRAEVTSPGGTTAAGLKALEASGIRNALLEAVSAATERSRQLGAS